MPIGPLDRLTAMLASEWGASPIKPLVHTIAAGWATVELERAAIELGDALGIAAARFVAAPETAALGARCLVANDVLPGGLSLALLEPATEGRLAATLARAGEGPAAIWLAGREWRRPAAIAEVEGVQISPAAPGPFGRERLILGGPRYGAHRLLVEPAGTIRQ